MKEWDPIARIGAAAIGLTLLTGVALTAAGWLRGPTPLAPVQSGVDGSAGPLPAAAPPATTGLTPLIGAWSSPGTSPGAAAAPSGQLLVHVAGQVKQPGLYTFASGARVHDALKAAGGATKGARLSDLNLAAPLKDGLRLYVPSATEAREQVIVTTEDVWVHEPPRQAAAPEDVALSSRLSIGAVRSARRSSERKEAPPGRINLNYATSAELQQLPGIGPSMAARIIAYRTTEGRFDSAEELQSVRGIGPKTYAKLRDYITAP